MINIPAAVQNDNTTSFLIGKRKDVIFSGFRRIFLQQNKVHDVFFGIAYLYSVYIAR